MTVQALYVDARGIYPRLLGAANCWPEERDARTYFGLEPVVAHPPCWLWVNMAAVNYARALKEPRRKKILPAWYPGGDDGRCFRLALAAVNRCGGVLEHPAGSWAWPTYGLQKPVESGWQRDYNHAGAWVCEVWQIAYGHKCRKRTWLYYVGARPPFDLDWRRWSGSHQIGWFDRKKPTVTKKEANASPMRFAETLIQLAEWSRA